MKNVEKHINDFNGKMKKLKKQYPTLYRALLSGDMNDRFFGGINSVSEVVIGDFTCLFIETPGHGWFVDLSGNVIGEEDDGLDNKKLNDAYKDKTKVQGREVI